MIVGATTDKTKLDTNDPVQWLTLQNANDLEIKRDDIF